MPTTTPFNNLITFSRGSNATVTGPNGLIQWAPNNLLTFSEQFDNATWIKSASGQVTVTANQAVAPDGTRTADLVVPNASSGYHNIRQGPTTAALVYTQTVYYKPSGYTKVAIREDFAVGQYAAFDCVGSGTIINKTAAASASITALGDGWYQLTLTPTTTTANQGMGVYIMDAGYTSGDPPSYTFTGNGTSGGFLWGAQLELGSTATTYNSTTVKNLLGFSEAFDNAAWTKTRASIVTGAEANPVNGLFNAQKLMEDTTASNTHGVSQTFAATSTTTPYTFSVYAKAAGRTTLWLIHANATNILFDLANGTCDVGGVITNVGSGWYRCSVTANAPDLLLRSYNYRLGAPGTNYTGDGNSGVYIYGAQLSDSASLDPYVPAPGAAPSSTAFYGPRFDFDPVTLQPRGLLVEEQRTNLVLYSEQLDNAAWVKQFGSITSTSAVSPSGAANADVFTPSAQFGNVSFLLSPTISTGSVSVSVWLRVASGTRTVSLRATTTALIYLSDVTVTSTWTRFTASFTYNGTDPFAAFVVQDRNASGFVPIEIWGAQLEAGAFATSYIPTVASTVTRSADVATITGQNFAQWFRQSEGTIVAECSYNALDTLVGICGADAGNGDNSHFLRGEPAVYRASTRSAGVTTSAYVLGAGMVPAGSKATYAYALNNCAAYANGLAATGTSGALPAVNLTQFTIGAEAFGTFLNGHIRNIRYIPARAADFQLQALTT